jgi:hypothetical protein
LFKSADAIFVLLTPVVESITTQPGSSVDERRACAGFGVEANGGKVRFVFTRLDRNIAHHNFTFVSPLLSCHTHRTLPPSSGDDNSKDAAITAYIVDTLLDVLRGVKGSLRQAKDVAGPNMCDITACGEDTYKTRYPNQPITYI